MNAVVARPLGRLERLAYERQARDLERWPARSQEECEPDGYWWDEEAADRVVIFIEGYCRHHKGEWAGQPFLLSDWQREIVRTVFGWRRPDGSRRFRTAYIEIPRKNGKGLAVDEWLPTPAGWVRAGDVRPGDMLFGRDGRPTRVLGVYPQPEQPLYRITFADGASVVVDGPHRWLVQVRDSSDGRWKEWTVMTTHELIQRGIAWRDGRGGFTYRFRVPVPEAVQYPEADLPIDPYLMGAWLGDGYVRAADAGITSADDDVLMACAALAPCTYVIDRPEGRTAQIRFHKPMRDNLAALGLAECKAHTKRIPRIYLQSSIAQRWALLQGLLDTDGFASKAGQIEFTTVSRELAEDVTELVRSLGGIVTSCVGRTPTYVSNGERRLGRVSWRMLVQLPEGTQAFRLQRKQERLRPRKPGWQLAKWRQIIGIEPVGVGRSVCFTVDAPDSLFLAGRGFIATHNTELAAAVALYLLVADGEEGAEIYSAATKKDQAKIVHDAAVQMVRRSPELRRFVQVYRNNLSVETLGAKFEPLSSDSDTLDGLNPHAAILDELHAHKDRHVRDVLLTGMGARRQPLEWIITTAGVYDPTSIGWEQHEYARSVLEGIFEDESYYAFIAAADPEDNWTDPETWAKANPNAGVSVKWEYLDDLAERAKRSPSFLNTFLRYHLNIWTQQLERWIAPEIWKKGAAPVNEGALEGERCFAALDLSSTTDLTALALAFPNDVGGYDLVMRYWVPEDRILERVRRDRVPYDAWVRDGWIWATPGDVVDYDWIRAEIHELADRFEIVEVAYDPWNATQLAVQLLGDGLPMVEMRQGYKTMSPAAKEFERLAVAGRIRHGGHPVLSWNVNNLAITTDPADNIKPDKQRSREKIDGAVAAIMAIGRASVQLDGGDENPYAEGGFFVL